MTKAEQKRPEDARRLYARAYAIAEELEPAGGPEHARLEYFLGCLAHGAGDLPVALVHYRAAEAIQAGRPADEEIRLGETLTQLAVVRQATGDHPGAIDAGRRAVGILRERCGVGHFSYRCAVFNLVELLAGDGELDEVDRLLDDFEKVAIGQIGPDHPWRADILRRRTWVADRRASSRPPAPAVVVEIPPAPAAVAEIPPTSQRSPATPARAPENPPEALPSSKPVPDRETSSTWLPVAVGLAALTVGALGVVRRRGAPPSPPPPVSRPDSAGVASPRISACPSCGGTLGRAPGSADHLRCGHCGNTFFTN